MPNPNTNKNILWFVLMTVTSFAGILISPDPEKMTHPESAGTLMSLVGLMGMVIVTIYDREWYVKQVDGMEQPK